MMDEKTKQKIIETTKEMLARLGYGGAHTVETHDSKSNLVVAIASDDKMGLLIGKNGQNINALEHLVRVLCYKETANTPGEAPGPLNFSLDINDYRKLRSGQVVQLAKDLAIKVSQTRRSEAMLPMNSYERRLVHTELASFGDIETESVGEEPRRRVVIKPTMEI